MNRIVITRRSVHSANYQKPKFVHPTTQKHIQIADHSQFGQWEQRESLAHLEFMKHKAILERPKKRREQHDWNMDAEIVAFGHRIGLGSLDPDQARVLLTTDELVPSDAINQLVRSTLDEILSAPDSVLDEIAAHLTSDDYLSKKAKSVGFGDFVDDDQIASKFTIFLEWALDEADQAESSIKHLLLNELFATHNVVLLWPRAWADPVACLNQIRPGCQPRLVKSVGENTPLPTYVVALFDSDDQFMAQSLGESPQLALEDAARVALQTLIKLK